MEKKYIGLSIILSLFIGFCCQSCKKNEANVSPNLLTLDSLLNYSDEFTLQRLKEVKEIKQKRKQAKSYAERNIYDNLLFDKYYTLNADSALHYADESIESATKAGNEEMLTHSKIDKSTALAATGLLNRARRLMNEINPASLSKEQLIEYYGQMIYLYSHLGNYEGSDQNDYYVTERLYKDSIMQIIPENHPDYLWYKSWDILGTNKSADSVIIALKDRLAESPLNERQDAKNAYALARLYYQKGDLKNYENYLTLSAIIDVKIGNSEIASLEDLARYLFKDGNGDVDRSYQYMDYSLNKALDYPNRTRAFGIAKTLTEINSAYQERISLQQRRLTVFLTLMCVLAAILIIAVIAIVLQKKKVVKQRKEVDTINDTLNQKVTALSEAETKLNEMNQLLKELNSDLQQKNEELYEANYVKEEYIGYVFHLCSSYINKIETLKRDIYLKSVKKQWKAIESETSDLDMKDELKEFYHSFDSIFLTIYPNFVSDFNSLLKPDKQIVLKDGELLNMELRIYALVKLGINDSVKIADFLHCAPQTVYNYRLRARSRARYDKADFIEMVKSLGSFTGRNTEKV